MKQIKKINLTKCEQRRPKDQTQVGCAAKKHANPSDNDGLG